MGYEVSDFEKEVIERSHSIPVLVDFWAEWCGPCKVLGPVLERLAAQSDGKWTLAKVNTEEHVEVAQKYQIQSIPNVKLFVDGKVVNEFVGALPEYQIQRWLQTAIPSKYRLQIDQAEAFLVAGNFAAAEALLAPVVAAEPGDVSARMFFARSIVFKDPARAAASIESIEDPKYSDVQNAIQTFARLHSLAQHSDGLPENATRPLYLAAIQLLVSQNFDAAMKKFIDIIRKDRYYDDDGARKACIALFKLLGEASEVTQNHRRDFSSALY
jgi:putative thioredoxin